MAAPMRAKYTKNNIEIQGLKLWLSGIGRPTGNARTERVIGTLKREEINLQEQYANEEEAKTSIKNKRLGLQLQSAQPRQRRVRTELSSSHRTARANNAEGKG